MGEKKNLEETVNTGQCIVPF